MNNKTIFIDCKDELLTSYLKDISKYKVLNSSEVAILVSKAQSGDEKARTELINSNLRFVVTIAESDVYCGSGIETHNLMNLKS